MSLAHTNQAPCRFERERDTEHGGGGRRRRGEQRREVGGELEGGCKSRVDQICFFLSRGKEEQKKQCEQSRR